MYRSMEIDLYASPVDVGITELRANLAEWIRRAGEGEDVVITDRGAPVAQLVPPTRDTMRLHQLIADGVLIPAERPKDSLPKPPNVTLPAGESLSDTVIGMRAEQRS